MGTYFHGYYFCDDEYNGNCVHTFLLILPLGVITSIRRYGRLVMVRYLTVSEKGNSFNPFTVL